MYKKKEIERKFLLAMVPVMVGEVAEQKKIIVQSYLPDGTRYRVITGIDEKPPVRTKTIKQPTDDPTVRFETETEISEAQMREELSGNVLEELTKIRWTFDYDTHQVVVDYYDDIILCIAEIELKQNVPEETIHKIELPKGLAGLVIMEVTGMSEFSNQNLAKYNPRQTVK